MTELDSNESGTCRGSLQIVPVTIAAAFSVLGEETFSPLRPELITHDGNDDQKAEHGDRDPPLSSSIARATHWCLVAHTDQMASMATERGARPNAT